MKREQFLNKIELHFCIHAVCAILGPRQVRKTTLARAFIADTPKITKSMNIALQDLKLDHLYIVYPYHTTYPITAKITALGLESLCTKKALSFF